MTDGAIPQRTAYGRLLRAAGADVPEYWRYVGDAEIINETRLIEQVLRRAKRNGWDRLDVLTREDELLQEARMKVFLLLSEQKRVSYSALINHLVSYLRSVLPPETGEEAERRAAERRRRARERARLKRQQ